MKESGTRVSTRRSPLAPAANSHLPPLFFFKSPSPTNSSTSAHSDMSSTPHLLLFVARFAAASSSGVVRGPAECPPRADETDTDADAVAADAIAAADAPGTCDGRPAVVTLALAMVVVVEMAEYPAVTARPISAVAGADAGASHTTPSSAPPSSSPPPPPTLSPPRRPPSALSRRAVSLSPYPSRHLTPTATSVTS